MDYNQLINNWHTKASDEDYFSKFVFEYLAFIAFVKKKKFTNTRQDREAIQRLKRETSIKDEYLSLVKEKAEIKEAWTGIMKELNTARLGNVSRNGDGAVDMEFWNCSYNDRRSKTVTDKQKASGVIHDLENWENMVEFWYSIRNNLFHGGKDPQDERDQILIEKGYITLKPLVEIFLTNMNN